MRILFSAVAATLIAVPVFAQPGPQAPPPGATNDPFPPPIATTADVVRVKFTEFATLPDVGVEAARAMTMVDEPGTQRLFVNDMRGPLYSVSYDGKTVTLYLDLRDAKWNVNVSRRAASAAFRASRFIRSSTGAARRATASSTRIPTRANTTRRSGLQARAAERTRTTRCCSSGRRRTRRPPPTTATRRAS